MQEKKDKGEGQLQYEIKLYQTFQGICKYIYYASWGCQAP